MNNRDTTGLGWKQVGTGWKTETGLSYLCTWDNG